MAFQQTLRWLFTADGSDFRNEVERSDRRLNRSSRRMRREFDQISGRLRSMRNVLLGVIGVAGFGALARDFLNTADEASKLSRAIGETTERTSTFAFAMERSGAAVSDLERIQGGLIRRIRQLRDPTSNAAQAAESLGVEIFDAEGNIRSFFDILTDTADGVMAFDDAMAAAEFGNEIFGRSFQNILPFLEQGGDQIQGLEQRARDLNREISTEAGLAAEDFNDAMKDLRTGAQGASQAFMEEMLPTLIVIAEAMADVSAEQDEMSRGLGDVADFLLKGGAAALQGFGQAVMLVGEGVGAAAAEIEQEMRGNFEGANAIREAMVESELRAAERIRGFQEGLWGAEEDLEERRKRQHQERMDRIEEERDKRLAAMEERRETRAEQQESEEAEEAARKRREEAEQNIENLEREIALFDTATRAEQTRFEIAQGQYADLGDAQQRKLLQLAQELDQLEKNRRAEREAAQARERAQTELEAAGERVFRATRTEAELLNAELKRLDELLALGAIGWETYERAVQQAGEQQEEMSEFAVQAARSIQSALADFLFDPFEEGLDGMLISFANTIRQMIAQAAAAEVLQAVGMSGFSEGGLAQGFAEGGPVTGPGTSTSDSIPARLSRGEFVQPTASTNYYGADYMEALRRRAIPRDFARGILSRASAMRPHVPVAPRFAEGGLAAGGEGAINSLRLIMVDDRANIGDYMSSAEGERVQLEFLQRNRNRVRRLIGGG